MVVSIVCELEDMGRKWCLFLGGIAILCCIFEENGIRVTGDVFVWVDGDQGGGIDGGIDVVSEKTLPKAGNNDFVRGVGEGGEVCDILKLLMVSGRLPIHRHLEDFRLLAGLQLSRRRPW